MILIPDIFLLRKIKEQHVYCDEKSLEESTGVEKRKYKLAGDVFSPLKIYAFFVLTTEKLACDYSTTIKVCGDEWENKMQGYLAEDYSYIDICKGDFITKDELLLKIKDRYNQFLCTGRLPDYKYEELKKLRSGAHKTDKHKSLEEIAMTDLALGGGTDHINDEILKSLGL